ncbi:uncharacterized protein LOC130891043 [Diorhabda carinulata]|uniref:uncharacterized protein LOC130891043 n=1 Tax=Diorhabda carinulata TaxID=1163345 RepID=UPI0025A138F0|nr:uncharacterized protein LOC130891043 [Diorhabda carinulata]
MTSTNINVGLSDSTRNSSRVLRPPGGGHTNIFDNEKNETKTTRKDHGRNASSILEGTNTDITQTSPVKTVLPSSQPEISKEPASSVQQKGRVPPGGFSSKLW